MITKYTGEGTHETPVLRRFLLQSALSLHCRNSSYHIDGEFINQRVNRGIKTDECGGGGCVPFFSDVKEKVINF